MVSKNKTTPDGKQHVERSNGDSARWIFGLLLFFTGLFAAASVLFYFISWDADLSVLQGVDSENPRFDDTIENLCGYGGAWIGEQIVGHGFGVFGMLIPVMVTLVGVRIIRQKPLLFNHSILSLFLILILGSLTLGFAFGDKWSLCSSSGWGGALGIEVARLLGAEIGAVGMIILLLGGWILTGVFINRNFINTVNTAGNAMVDQGEKIVGIVRNKVVSNRSEDERTEAQEPEAVALASAPVPPAPKPAPQLVTEVREQPVEEAAAAFGDGDNPFLEISTAEIPVEITRPARPASGRFI